MVLSKSLSLFALLFALVLTDRALAAGQASPGQKMHCPRKGDSGEVSVVHDTVIIAGKSYRLAITDSEAVPPWKRLKVALPKGVSEMPAGTDSEVLRRLEELSKGAQRQFERLDAAAFRANKDRFRQKYQGGDDATIRQIVSAAYPAQDNGDIAPEAQRAYNEYAALAQVMEAMRYYMAGCRF